MSSGETSRTAEETIISMLGAEKEEEESIRKTS